MGSSTTLPPWWDRETGDSGLRLRADVRASAKELWPRICREVTRILGDASDAHELLEKAVQSVSIYLERRGTEAHDPGGLLVVAIHRNAQRLARKRGRIQLAGSSSELSEQLGAPDWVDAVERRLFLDQLIDHLRPETRGILRLRLEDFSWNEIARMRRTDAAKIRKEFWRDLRRAHFQLLNQPPFKKHDSE